MSGIYSAAAGMAAQQTWLDALANDIANVNTPGYKQQRIAFRDLEYSGFEVGAGAAATSIGLSDAQGSFVQSDDPLALAIEGPGYLKVKRADGSVALTRNGQLHLDANGSLTTATGERLEPPVTLPQGTDVSLVKIARDGTVTASGGAKLGKIDLADVPVPGALQAVGDGLLVPTAASGQPIAAGGQIRQGWIEQSNVDLADAMVNMIQAQRAFQLASRAVQTQDQLAEIANGIRR